MSNLSVHALIKRDENGKLWVSSRDVARIYEKKHKNVILAIRQLISEKPEFTGLNFKPCEYLDEKGRARPMYYMTESGFFTIVGGFTGQKARDLRVTFVETFDKMKNEILPKMAEELKNAREENFQLKNQPPPQQVQQIDVNAIVTTIVQVVSQSLTQALGQVTQQISERLDKGQELIADVSKDAGKANDRLDRARDYVMEQGKKIDELEQHNKKLEDSNRKLRNKNYKLEKDVIFVQTQADAKIKSIKKEVDDLKVSHKELEMEVDKKDGPHLTIIGASDDDPDCGKKVIIPPLRGRKEEQ